MKKALVILLSLLVVGGVFAQTVTISGDFEGGIGILKLQGEDDMRFGVVSPNNGQNGVRAQLGFTAVNKDGNAGFTGNLRASGNNAQVGPQAGSYLGFQNAFGWIKLFDIVEFRGGLLRSGNGVQNNEGLGNQDLVDSPSLGVQVFLKPMDILTVAVGAFSPDGLMTGDDLWETGSLRLWGGLGVNVVDIADVRLAIEHTDLDTNMTFHVGIAKALPVGVYVSAYLQHLNEFSDIGIMNFSGRIGMDNVLLDGLSLSVGALFSISQADDTDPFMAFGFWGSFPIGVVVPRLDFWFVSGGTYRYTNALGFGATEPNRWGRATFNADQMYINIRPVISLKAANNCVFDIGAVFNIDVGDAPHSTAYSETGVNIGFFTATRVNF